MHYQGKNCNSESKLIHVRLVEGQDDGDMRCALMTEIYKCLNDNGKKAEMTCSSSTCQNFDPSHLIPKESDQKKFTSYIRSYNNTSLAVIIFEKPIVVSSQLINFFINNFYDSASINKLLSNSQKLIILIIMLVSSNKGKIIN